ncbi:MAG: LON peptidase substrate-binding domain-containing protein [Candidatus Neomarinimicrobiota bacterium]
MSNVDDLLKAFSGTTPLFPLQDTVLFPKTVQPFHIFEPRYLKMVRDVMKGERLVTIPLLRELENGQRNELPTFRSIATMAYINTVQPGEEDTLNILVTGLVKVHIEELESDEPYRRGAVTPLKEFDHVTNAEGKRRSILSRFQSLLEKSQVQGSLDALGEEQIPLEMLAHVVISALPVPAAEMQKMLELQSLELRIDILLNFLDSGLHSFDATQPFDPIMPTNPTWN